MADGGDPQQGHEDTFETCEECAFDARSWRVAQAAKAFRALGADWAELLAAQPAERLRARPAPDVWSPLEYAVHTREVLDLWHEGLLALLAGDPFVVDFEREPDADRFPYNEEDPAHTAASLREACDRMAGLRRTTNRLAWSEPIRVEPEAIEPHFHAAGWRTLLLGWLHALHDGQHHLMDARRILASA